MRRMISILISLLVALGITYVYASWSEKFDSTEYERIYRNTADIFVSYEGNTIVPMEYNETASLLKSRDIDLYGITLRSSRYSIFFKFTGSNLIWKDFLMEIEYYRDGVAYATQKYSLDCVDPRSLNEICLARVPYADSMRIKSLSYFVVSPDELLYRSKLYKCGDTFLNKYAAISIRRLGNNHVEIFGLVNKNCKCTIFIHNSDGKIIDTIDTTSGMIHVDKYTDFGVKYYSVVIRSN